MRPFRAGAGHTVWSPGFSGSWVGTDSGFATPGSHGTYKPGGGVPLEEKYTIWIRGEETLFRLRIKWPQNYKSSPTEKHPEIQKGCFYWLPPSYTSRVLSLAVWVHTLWLLPLSISQDAQVPHNKWHGSPGPPCPAHRFHIQGLNRWEGNPTHSCWQVGAGLYFLPEGWVPLLPAWFLFLTLTVFLLHAVQAV